MARLDRRVARTRAALIDAFNYLVLVRRQRRIRVDDIVSQAQVGRSTFYEHYAGPDAILLEALKAPMTPIADAASGAGDLHRVTHILQHFWDNRAKARDTLAGQMDARVTRLLAGMIEERLAARDVPLTIPAPIAARQLADAALGPVRAWIQAEAPCDAPALAQAICGCGEAMVAALSQPARN